MGEMATEDKSNAPYYYSELMKKEMMSTMNGTNLNLTNLSSVKNNSSNETPNSSSSSNTSNAANAIDNNSSGRNMNSLIGPIHCSVSEESPTSSSVSSSRPSSSRDVQQPTLVQPTYGTIGGNGGHIPPPASFANPLLNIEPDTRGSESLPRSFQQHKKPHFQKSSSKGIYQRSLSLLANGVSPLLRKKHPSPQNAKPPEPIPEMSNSASTASLARRRRKSEPIMFGLDPVTNEMNLLQKRQERMLENLDLNFEKMLMTEENGNAPTYVHSAQQNQAVRETLNSSPGNYGRTIQPNLTQQFYYGREPLYMLYDDSHRNRAEENIYEEVDFMSIASLRAQYADTLSLQSWKKKGSKKGLSSAAPSSFTRWFSTRKKSSPTASNAEDNPYGDVKLSKKQRPPICLPDVPPQGLSQSQLKRRLIVGSIVDSENSYINSLHRLINDFKKPMEEASPPILSQNKINIIFSRLEQILQCHAIFGIALSHCVREWDEKECIGDVFIASFSKSIVLDIYSDFINNFQNAMDTAKKASKSKTAFAQFLREKSISSPDRLSFFGLMVKPVQRFPQFILFLNDLLKHTPADHPDRMSLQLALTQLETLADRLNERKRDSEGHFAVKQLLKDYFSSSSANSRYLLRMDNVCILDLDSSTGLVLKTKRRKLYLLNDTLVCVSISSNKHKFAVPLQDVDVIDDITPATNNLLANSVLRTKDTTSASSSPQHCTIEGMYCDLNNLVHDSEIMSRINNLVSSLRYQYAGLSVEMIQSISAEITNEIRRKDAQMTLIDRSCFQLRMRSKNYKDLIHVQMSDPEVKKDWLTDVRLAKLSLDRANNPAWDVVFENISSSSGNINAMTQQRVPLFVKSLPIFATTDLSQLTCALHYRIYSDLPESDSGVLWICNVNEKGSQLGALATNGSDVALIHSYELCDSRVSCLESVGSFSVWVGLKQGRVIVIDASSPGEWQQLASLDVSGGVTCMRYFNQYVYVGLEIGMVTLFDIDRFDEPIHLTLSSSPVTCLLPINSEMYACCGSKIWVISGQRVEKSYSLENQTQTDIDSIDESLEDELKPNLLAHCGIGLWVSILESSIIKLYHTETFKHLQDLNVAPNVKRVITDLDLNVPIHVTSMLATRGLLWIGTSVGVIVTLTLPRLQGLPLVSGCLNVALHRHLGPVTTLLSLTPGATPVPNIVSSRSEKSHRNSMEVKNEEIESIYGLYADLMKTNDYMDVRSRPATSLTTSRINWDLSNMNVSDDSTSESGTSSAIYHESGTKGTGSSHTSPKEGGKEMPRTGTNNLYDKKKTSGSESNVTNLRNINIFEGNTSVNNNCKTALLMTGGNGYKRDSQDNPYLSHHAHCIIWEYKL